MSFRLALEGGSACRSSGIGAPPVAARSILVGPQRDRRADDRRGGDRTEIPSVEAGLDGPVHEEELVCRNAPAALPDRHRSTDGIAPKRLSHRDAVDSDGSAGAADGLARKPDDALQKWDVRRQIPAPCHETFESFGRIDGDEVRHVEPFDGLHLIEPDRCRRAGVPDDPRGKVDESRDRDGADRRGADKERG